MRANDLDSNDSNCPLIQDASLRASRFFFRFCFRIHRRSGSGECTHFSMRGLPISGCAATATLQPYAKALRTMLNREPQPNRLLMATENVARLTDRRFSLSNYRKNQRTSALYLRNLRSIFVRHGSDHYRITQKSLPLTVYRCLLIILPSLSLQNSGKTE